MLDEFLALLKNDTWELVPRPHANVVRSHWVYCVKYRADSSLECYKAHLVADGSSQQAQVDYDETFSPVVRPATIRMVLCIVLSKGWPINQLDVKNAFLHSKLDKTIFHRSTPRIYRCLQSGACLLP